MLSGSWMSGEEIEGTGKGVDEEESGVGRRKGKWRRRTGEEG